MAYGKFDEFPMGAGAAKKIGDSEKGRGQTIEDVVEKLH